MEDETDLEFYHWGDIGWPSYSSIFTPHSMPKIANHPFYNACERTQASNNVAHGCHPVLGANPTPTVTLPISGSAAFTWMYPDPNQWIVYNTPTTNIPYSVIENFHFEDSLYYPSAFSLERSGVTFPLTAWEPTQSSLPLDEFLPESDQIYLSSEGMASRDESIPFTPATDTTCSSADLASHSNLVDRHQTQPQ
ncbi:hypothetical protein PEBR_20349 [Penicillium brasilianum]|uniref:Uncharacterized protein n=1 Tax=Penicillium brasilianum TaxID=104259 RepID=A0A1S9RQ95_PENBI|nr:hypothetical protein PEBR_20349 [Penicillium brasilianum]